MLMNTFKRLTYWVRGQNDEQTMVHNAGAWVSFGKIPNRYDKRVEIRTQVDMRDEVNMICTNIAIALRSTLA